MPTKLLVVDDEVLIRELLCEYFDKAGVQVIPADGTSQALHEINLYSFDAALIDLRLVDSDGIELVKSLSILAPATPTIIMTGYPTVGSVVASLREGAFDFVVKPFRLKELHSVISRALNEHQRRLEFASLKTRVRSLENELTNQKTIGVIADRIGTRKRVKVVRPADDQVFNDANNVL